MSAAIKVLRNLANDMIVKICPHLISQLSLSLEFDDDCDVENELEFLSAVTLCYDTAIKSKPLGLTHSDDLHDPVHRNSIEEIRNRYYLKVCKFGFGLKSKLLLVIAIFSLDCFKPLSFFFLERLWEALDKSRNGQFSKPSKCS